MKCFECDGTYKKEDYDYYQFGVYLCKVKALICNKCDDLVFGSDANKKIQAAAKRKGLWGLGRPTKIGKVGNSLDVKINKRLADFMGIKKWDEVNVYPDGKKKLIVEIY